MPRPNHDIPNLLLGGVRDYAAEHDLDPEEAHADLLRIALQHVGILAKPENTECSENPDSDDSDGSDA